ncbi:tRNA wybutosine-synthesizing protein 4-like [Ornithodoros turicata]|uniref:tRNA wybutosine-synthesizing protein 4-like n=1 Tax=Ornithodoros turicata TaxID=34597 RepID=UPI003139A6A0
MTKNKNHRSVQSTNDSSIHSKLSVVNSGYIKDDFIEFFCIKKCRRSPLINRGYYVRAKTVSSVLEAYCKSMKNNKCQVLSLGAGFDTTFFRLKAAHTLPSSCRYYEVDLPQVVQKKCEVIANSPQLSDLAGTPTGTGAWTHYCVLTRDLAQTDGLKTTLEERRFDFDLPTLILAECVLSYLDVDDSNALIKWTTHEFSNCAFVVYEQVYPSDGFGMFMLQHFATLGSPLKSLHNFPDPSSLMSRYQSLGYDECKCIGMNDFFTWLDDVKRIRSLEPFDEFEEWHEKCNHYALTVATKGRELVSLPFFKDADRTPIPLFSAPIKPACVWTHHEAPQELWRAAHSSVILSKDTVLTVCGFANSDGVHKRVFTPVLTDLETNTTRQIEIDSEEAFDGRQHACVVRFADGSIFINGGRTSPLHACQDDIMLHPCGGKPDRFTATCIKRNSAPKPRWRHTLNVVQSRGREFAFLFGGRTPHDPALNDCYVYSATSNTWTEIPHSAETPSRRHSHAAVTVNDTKVLVTCGLGEDEVPSKSIYSYDAECGAWEALRVSGVTERYSHSAHFLWPNLLLLVGGVSRNHARPCGVGVVNLTSGQCVEVAFPCQSPERPIMLFKHTSVLCEDAIMVTGGGGNCFSFGTHFNKWIVKIDVRSCLSNL